MSKSALESPGNAGIYIPTRGRLETQRTWDSLPASFRDDWGVVLVCPPNEVAEHRARGRAAIPCHHDGIGPTRQFIMDTTDKPFVIMCDDDHDWMRRADPKHYRLEPIPPEETPSVFERMVELLRVYALVGVSARAGNNRHFPERVVEVTRQNNVHGINVAAFNEIGARFDEMPLMEDFDVTLTFLRAGCKNALIADMAWGQPASNAEGGCSIYRDANMQEIAARLLKLRHPEFVKLVDREATSGWKGMRIRKDVRISWRKAYQSSFAAQGR